MLDLEDSHFNYRVVYKGQLEVKVHVFECVRIGKRRGYSSTLYPTYEDALDIAEQAIWGLRSS